MIVAHRLHRLARLAKADPDKRFDRLFREITEVDFLMYAFEQIADNKGSYTPGIDGKTKQHWNPTQARRVSEMLRDGTYTPLPVRRVYIPKKSGKVRPLGIPTFTDRVVQSAIKLILEALYESVFRDCSHGFRPGRGCHTALHAVCDSPKVRIDWVVEGDIKGCFDNVSHQILMRLLQKRIKDDRLLKLIAKFLKAGYFERELWNPTKAGTPQGGIISPILANIYLHEMDCYIERTYGANQSAPQTGSERHTRVNPEYKSLDSKILRARRMLRGVVKPTAPAEALRKHLQELIAKRKAVPYMVKPIKSRVTYTRYADDFVIVLRNLPKSEAVRIREDLTKWLYDNLRLILSLEKTAVTHIDDGFAFLGYKLIAAKQSESKQPRVHLVVPYESVEERIRLVREMCAHSEQAETDVIRRLNLMLRGWMNYYRCVSSPSRAFKNVLSEAFWAYGNYVAKKHDMYIGLAAKRWIDRCPPTRTNPRGDQKTWRAESRDKDGKVRVEYLICTPAPRQSLHELAQQIRRKGESRTIQGEIADELTVVSGEPCAVKAARTVR